MASEVDAPASGGEERPKSTRRTRRGSGPDTGALDQLLDDPPHSDHHLGRFAGYRDGARPRRLVGGVLGAAALAGVVIFFLRQREFEREAEQAEYERLHPWQLPADADVSGRSRDFHLTDGRMRMALSREAPGVERIITPDKVISLAEGSDTAQIIIEVREGRTVGIKTLAGEVAHRDRRPDEPL